VLLRALCGERDFTTKGAEELMSHGNAIAMMVVGLARLLNQGAIALIR